MGGFPDPRAVRMMAQAAQASPQTLMISHLLRAEWGEERWGHISEQMRECVEAETGRPHHWRPMINMDAYELVPVGTNQ